MQLSITTHYSLDTSFTVRMKDKPRIFLPGIPEFTQHFLFKEIKFPSPLVLDLTWSSCLGRSTQSPGQSSRVVGDSMPGRGNVNQGHVGSQDGKDLLDHQTQAFTKASHNAERTPGGLPWGESTTVALISILSEEQLDEERPNLEWNLEGDYVSSYMLLSDFPQHIYLASVESLLLALIQAIAKHNPSNSRYCGEKCCPPKVSLNNHNHKQSQLVSIVLITRAKPIFQHTLCEPWLFFHWTSTGRFLKGALRNTWAAAEPPASKHLLRGHLFMNTEVLGIMCSCKELRGKDISLLPSHHKPCPSQLLLYRVVLSAQKPFLLPSQICPAPCHITLPADLSRKEESSSHLCCVPGCMDLFKCHSLASKPHELYSALVLLKLLWYYSDMQSAPQSF